MHGVAAHAISTANNIGTKITLISDDQVFGGMLIGILTYMFRMSSDQQLTRYAVSLFFFGFPSIILQDRSQIFF